MGGRILNPMRGSWWHRLLSALLAVWFVLSVAEPAWLHACPMHGGRSAAASVATVDPVGAGAHAMTHCGAHAPTDAMASERETAPRTHAPADVHHVSHPPAGGPHGGPHDGAHPCTCLGACCAAIPALLPASPVTVTALVTLAPVTSTGRPEHEYVAGWVDFVLPFATAPPSRG
jgi:hypothetical protein